MEYKVIHNEKKLRFELDVEGYVCYIAYQLFPGGIDFISTFVPTELEGRDIGSVLAHYVLEYARKNNLRVKATCPFIRRYMEWHEYEFHL